MKTLVSRFLKDESGATAIEYGLIAAASLFASAHCAGMCGCWAILAGQQPRCMSLLWFQRNPLPTDWLSQREIVVGFDA